MCDLFVVCSIVFLFSSQSSFVVWRLSVGWLLLVACCLLCVGLALVVFVVYMFVSCLGLLFVCCFLLMVGWFCVVICVSRS